MTQGMWFLVFILIIVIVIILSIIVGLLKKINDKLKEISECKGKEIDEKEK